MGQTRLPHLFLDYDIITFSFLHIGMMMIHFLFCDTSEKENGNIIYIYKVKVPMWKWFGENEWANKKIVAHSAIN